MQPLKIVFPYLAQLHQVLHSLPIAAELALRYPDTEVHVAGATPSHLDFIRRLVAQHAPGAALKYDQLALGWFERLKRRKTTPWKEYTLFKNREYFSAFDAIVTPERTSLKMRRHGVTRPRLIWTRHGAGDREIGFARDVCKFDFVAMAGRKIERRLLPAGLIRPGHYVTGIYAKFDWAKPCQQRWTPFANGRPTVLYAPHFQPQLSSWETMGRAVLDHFARSEHYNLIFAPHVRLFDAPTADKYRPFERYQNLPNLRIDLGSERSVDMSYSAAADLYLGDVSSQVAEFLCSPRPCVFLNAHQARWRDDPNYLFWSLGPVLDSLDRLDRDLRSAFETHPEYEQLQRRYVADSFDLRPGLPSAPIAARAIVNYLRRVEGLPATAESSFSSRDTFAR